MEKTNKPKINDFNEPWIVQADPEWKGKHPCHDTRFITTAGMDFEDSHSEGSIICSLRDLAHQSDYAHRIIECVSSLRGIKTPKETLLETKLALAAVISEDDGKIPTDIKVLCQKALNKLQGD